MVRAFVAVELSDAVKEGLERAQERLRTAGGRLNLVDPALAHLTLKFLGEVEPEKLERVKTALLNIRERGYDLTAAGVSGNNPRRPRVVWFEVQDGGGTARLAEAVERALSPLGFEREKRGFTPHVTLARVKDFDPSLPETIAGIAGMEAGTCTIDRITLKKSTLTPKGPIYETLLEVPLDME